MADHGSIIHARKLSAHIEFLEARRLLSAAPAAADDRYFISPDGRLSVDVAPTVATPIYDDSPPSAPRAPGNYDTIDFELTVDGGRLVAAPQFVQIGAKPNAEARVLVTGPRSLWRIPDWLEAGGRGKATITVTDQATLNVQNFFALADHGEGALTVSGGGLLVTQNFTTIAGDSGGVATADITGLGTRWRSGNHVEVGQVGDGTLRIGDGAAVTVAGTTYFGYGGHGTLGLSGGGTLTQTGSASIGSAGYGTAVVTGAKTKWTIQDWTGIGSGSGARGSLDVSAGAVVTQTNFTTLGEGGYGTARVAGAGSRWDSSNWLSVGDSGGFGELVVADGGVVTNKGFADIGDSPGSFGRITVDGAASRWLNQGDRLTLGDRSGQGALIVRDGGRVESGPITLFAGGRLLGAGSIRTSNVFNGGVIDPGETAFGLLRLEGNLRTAQHGAAPGTLRFDLGGTDRGAKYDAIDVTQRVELDGVLSLNFVNGFTPRAGDRFNLIHAASMTGDFQSVQVRGLAPGLQYSLAKENGELTLVVNSDGQAATVISSPSGRGVLANDLDDDGDRAAAILVERPAHGKVSLFNDGSFTYVADATFTGQDTFRYRAGDATASSGVATVTIRSRPAGAPELLLASTKWSQAFFGFLQKEGLGNGGFSLTEGPHGDAALPWNDIDQIKLRFGEQVSVSAADLVVQSLKNTDDSTTFDYDVASHTATLTFARPLKADRLDIRFVDQRWHAEILPGDVDRSGRVDAADLVAVQRRIGRSALVLPIPNRSTFIYSPFSDFDGDGVVKAVDWVLVRNAVGLALPIPLVSFGPTLRRDEAIAESID